MKTLTNRQLAKEFNKFLRENECASKFYVNFYNRIGKEFKNKWGIAINLNEYLNTVKTGHWLFEAFLWKYTPQNSKHWEYIHHKWYVRLKEIGYKP